MGRYMRKNSGCTTPFFSVLDHMVLITTLSCLYSCLGHVPVYCVCLSCSFAITIGIGGQCENRKGYICWDVFSWFPRISVGSHIELGEP